MVKIMNIQENSVHCRVAQAMYNFTEYLRVEGTT